MKDYLNKYGIIYNIPQNKSSTDLLQEEDFIEIVGKFNNISRDTQQPGLISDYINELLKKQQLYQTILDKTKDITTDDFKKLIGIFSNGLFIFAIVPICGSVK